MSAIESTEPTFLEHLARHVSHQLNNPIASIGSAAYLIEDILTPEANASEAIQSSMPFVQSIREDATRLKELVDEFRRFFIGGNFLPMKVNLSEFLRTRIARIAGSGMEVKLEIPDGAAALESELDLGLMQSAFELLFKELTARGVTSLKVTESQSDGKNNIQFLMPKLQGMDADSAANFFEAVPFASGQGLGLTLPYIRKVVETHSGSIRAEIGGAGDFIIVISLPQVM